MNSISNQDSGQQARICLPTARNFTKRVFQCGFYEAQDVLAATDGVELIGLEPGPKFRFRESWHRRLLYHDRTRKLIFRNPGLRKVRLTQKYDLFIIHCQTYWDFLYLGAIENWRDHCKTAVVWIDELWASYIPAYKYWLHALKQFDHVFVGYRGTVEPLSKAIGKQCHWMPGAVDTLRFSPYPKPSPRVVDVYSIGRRWAKTHQQLVKAAERKELFYVHDTVSSVQIEVNDHREHREMFANMAKRSKYFMVAPGKVDVPEETQGQVEIGFRYYEAAAAGAVMIGQSPNCDAFRETFPWPNPVITIKTDGSDILQVMAELNAEPERFSAISRRNAAEALLRHDWIYRWKEIFKIAGIELSPKMLAREKRLKELAEMIVHGQEVGVAGASL